MVREASSFAMMYHVPVIGGSTAGVNDSHEEWIVDSSNIAVVSCAQPHNLYEPQVWVSMG